jgi:hypothetical protein
VPAWSKNDHLESKNIIVLHSAGSAEMAPVL